MSALPSPSGHPDTLPTGPRVLLVDDDQDDQFLIQQAFTACGKPHQLFFAADGEDCLNFLAATNQLPNLVVLDLNMPRLNGFEVLKHLQTIPQWHDMAVVVISTVMDQSSKQLALSLGANDFLTKPGQFGGYQSLVDQLYAYCQ